MYRFVVLVWNSHDIRRAELAEALARRLQASASDWVCVTKIDGLRILHSGVRPGTSEALPLANQSGTVLGTLFRGRAPEGQSSKAILDEGESIRIVATRGQRLLDAYWGRYVAVIQDAAAGRVSVLRDPSGGFPCLLVEHNGISIFFSDMEDVLALGLPSFSINWSFIRGAVCSRALQVRSTGLVQVSEVQPGERVDIQRDQMKRTLQWHPLRIARSDTIEDVPTAVAQMRAVIYDCINAWASRYSGVLHRLSGGLDSSIVASCLGTAPSNPRVTCLNYFGHGPHEDERHYARLAAQHAGLPLIEHEHDAESVRLEGILNIAHSEKPRFYVYHVEHGRFEAQLAREHGASALFGGAGGDGLFFQNSAALAAVDYLHVHGIQPRLLRVALNAARVDRISMWAVLRRAIGEVLGDWIWNPLEELGQDKVFVNRDVIEAVKRDYEFAYPWMREAAGVPHGKLFHTTAALLPLTFYDALSQPDDPETVYPLMSQPLIELCLRLPVHVLIDGGWDRAIVRKAFEHDVPREIIRRRAKGASTPTARKLFDRNRPFIRELLLDGVLVREGFLDRKKLDTYLASGHAATSLAFGEILMEHICTEAWLRSWTSMACVASVA